MLIRRAFVLSAVFVIAIVARAQPTNYAPNSELPAAPEPAATPVSESVDASKSNTGRPGASETFHDFVMSAAGPYSIGLGAFTAAIHQATNNPPEWQQGAAALGKRFGSNMGISAVGSATRVGFGALLNQDTSYHRCKCTGVPHRLTHAAFSAFIAHQRSNGHAVLSLPGLAAPYTATMTAVYAWYPARYGAKDAFRMGNYNLLGTVGTNITFEFLPSSVTRFLARMHLSNQRISTDQD
jgi:hypothetical protein